MKNKFSIFRKSAAGHAIEGALTRPIGRRLLLKGALAATPLLLAGPIGALLTVSKLTVNTG